jgi:hypothetical protein
MKKKKKKSYLNVLASEAKKRKKIIKYVNLKKPDKIKEKKEKKTYLRVEEKRS